VCLYTVSVVKVSTPQIDFVSIYILYSIYTVYGHVNTGTLDIIKSMDGINLTNYTNVYFTSFFPTYTNVQKFGVRFLSHFFKINNSFQQG